MIFANFAAQKTVSYRIMVKEYVAPEMEELEINVENGILNPSFGKSSNDDYDYEEFNGWE